MLYISKIDIVNFFVEIEVIHIRQFDMKRNLKLLNKSMRSKQSLIGVLFVFKGPLISVKGTMMKTPF